MGKFVGIVGDTGSGKSRSILNLNSKTTVIINVLGKDLPFKGASKIYNKENKNIFQYDTYSDILRLLKNVNEKATHVKTIVIDDMRFLMTKEFFSRAKETGYVKYTEIAQNFQNILESIQNLRDDLIVFGFLHEDDVYNDKILVSKKIKLVGKLVEDQYNPLEVMGICLYCKPSMTENGMLYQFYTNKTWINGVEIMTKSPEDMFQSLTIPNDLKIVLDAIYEYY